MSVEVENITKIYGEQKAIDQISFSIQPGDILGFLGPNGAGKSTTMKILTCFIPQSSGKASVCGFDTVKQSIDVRKNIGYLPENNPLYLDMYVKEYLEFSARIHQMKQFDKRIAEIIDQTGLTIERKKKIGQLSKGYRQRVGLAQAILHNPKVLIFDEPTSGLDPNQLVEIRSLIKELGKEKTVILSTHIMQEVQAICNRVIIIHKGKIVANDTVDGIQAKSKGLSKVHISFKEKVDINLLKGIKGAHSAMEQDGNQFIIEYTGTEDMRELLFKFAVEKNYTLLNLQIEKQNLEDVFQELTKTES